MTKYYFTYEEKKKALEKKGYRIEKHTIKRWYKGDWEDFTAEFALLEDRRPHLGNTVQEEFNYLLQKKERQDKEKFLNSL